MKRGLTLIELVITVLLMVAVGAVIIYFFRAVLLTWTSQEARTGVDISLDWGIEQMVRDLREASEAQSTAGYDEIRFTHDGVTYYIYYLYNEDDSYGPPPDFDQDSYELKRAALAGGINGAFSYGDGRSVISQVLPPPTTDLSMSGNIIAIDLSVERKEEAIRARTEVKPRNL